MFSYNFNELIKYLILILETTFSAYIINKFPLKRLKDLKAGGNRDEVCICNNCDKFKILSNLLNKFE